ncbi:MAG: hypothetical protein ACTHQM_02150 [Thermoanaerobaculia bacterium]
MLLDEFMPRFDVAKRHSTLVNAPRERVYDAIRTADLTAHPVVKVLLALRGMGLRRKRVSLQFHEGFTIAADDRPNELVIGLEGPFWHPLCRPRGVDAQRFHQPVAPNTARGGWNFTTESENDATRLRTETRVLCADDARAKFRAYWFFIGPFSGLIRRFMLAAIKREAER